MIIKYLRKIWRFFFRMKYRQVGGYHLSWNLD